MTSERTGRNVPRTQAPGCPPGYNAREQGLWAQLQGVQQHTGRLEGRVAHLEALTARLLGDLRDVRGAVDHLLVQVPWPAPPADAPPADPGPPFSDADAANREDPAPARKRKGGAA